MLSRHECGSQTETGEAKYHSPGKGQIREAVAELWVIWQRAGVMARWAQPWEKVGIPRENGARAGEELMLLGNRAANVRQGCCLLPRPRWSPYPASGQGLLGIFPPIKFPSFSAPIRELMEGRGGDGWMLKLVGGWTLAVALHPTSLCPS